MVKILELSSLSNKAKNWLKYQETGKKIANDRKLKKNLQVWFLKKIIIIIILVLHRKLQIYIDFATCQNLWHEEI